MHLEKEDYGELVSVNIPLILRTDSSESGQGRHPKTIIEVACEVKLRNQSKLKEGDVVEVELPD